MRRTPLLAVLVALAVAACGGSSSPKPGQELQDAADRTVAASSFRVEVMRNDQLVERVHLDKENGITVTLDDGAEARQIGTQVYYRDANSSEWLTGSAPKSKTIADFGVAALRSAQAAQSVRRGSRGFTFTAKQVAMSARIDDGFIVEINQTFDSPVSERRTFKFSQFGQELNVDAPSLAQTRQAAPADCAEGSGGPRSLVCAGALIGSSSSLAPTTAPNG